jgi:hypothetical protein
MLSCILVNGDSFPAVPTHPSPTLELDDPGTAPPRLLQPDTL